MADRTIYALSDPGLPSLVRYVGMTKTPLKERLRTHIAYASRKVTPKNCWIVSLRKCGVQPRIWPIELCDDLTWEEAEKRWIAFFKPLPGLLNLTDGGDRGGPDMTGYRHTAASREKIAAAGRLRKSTPKMIRLLIARNKNRVYTNEMRAKLAAINLGRKQSDEEKERRASKLRGMKRSPETRLKLSEIQRKLAPNRYRSVVCIETGMRFDSLKQAEDHVGSNASIGRAIKLNIRCKSFHWRYENA